MSFRLSPIWWPVLVAASPVIVPWLLVKNRRFQKGCRNVDKLNQNRINQAEPQAFTAQFKRVQDPEAPEDQKTKLSINGKLRQTKDGPSSIDDPVWWFRKIEGWVPADPSNPHNGKRENVLIVWRNLNGDLEQDNAVLDEWFRKNRISTRDFEFDTIYVNGSNNLPNLRLDSENWKVRLTEEEFMKRMWDVEGV